MRVARLNPDTNRLELYQPRVGDTVELRGDDSTSVALDADDEKDELGSFKILAYSGAPVERWFGKMVIDTGGIQHDKTTTLLLEHDDKTPLGVIMKHKRLSDHGYELSGHFLSPAASPEAHRLRLQCRDQAPGKPGIRPKSSIGVRFMKFRFLEKGDEPVEVNGKAYKFTDKHDTLIVEKCFLFENSVIYVNPADQATTTEIMRNGNGERPMADLLNSETDPMKTGAPAATGQGGAGPGAVLVVPGQPRVTFSSLSAEDRRVVLVEAQAALAARERDFKAAFPNQPAAWLDGMVKSEKTLEQAKLTHYDELAAVERAKADQQAINNRVAERLKEMTGRDGIGFDASGKDVKREQALGDVTLAPEYEEARRVAEQRLHAHPLAVSIFGHEALERMTRAVKYECRAERLKDEQRTIDVADHEIEKLAQMLWAATPLENRRKVERLASGGHGGIDLGVITVRGFLDTYHEAMMSEPSWGVELMYLAPSDQPADVIRWLGYWPQLAIYGESPEEALLPVYQMSWTTDWYDATVPFDIQDWILQKHDMLNKAVANSGGVHKRHWNKLGAEALEANAKGYDGSLLYATGHAMGGKAPATQSNDLSVANGNAFCGVPDLANVSPAQMNTVLLNAAAVLLNYFAANGEPLNEEENRRVLIVCPQKFAPICEGAVYSDRLDGTQGGAGGSRTNPIKVFQEKHGDTWRVQGSARLASQTGHTTDNYIYMSLVGNDRKPLIRAEPIPLRLYFQGEGSEMHRAQNRVGFFGRTMRKVIPGAWSSTVRIAVGT